MQRIVFFAIAVLFTMPRLSSAQDTPRFGIVMGYPAALQQYKPTDFYDESFMKELETTGFIDTAYKTAK